jgi:hypothetical protein
LINLQEKPPSQAAFPEGFQCIVLETIEAGHQALRYGFAELGHCLGSGSLRTMFFKLSLKAEQSRKLALRQVMEAAHLTAGSGSY